jgi:3-hydroxyisobutyrate dehydrogenase-like beta-hydroxyacid dehydrogenase
MKGETGRVGIVGVGLMGHGIARNIIKRGRALDFLDHPGNQPTDDLAAAGARSAPDLATLAARCDIIILCVTGSPEVEGILTGAGGLIEAMRPGTIIIDCSTAIPSSTGRMASAVTTAGGRFLDAPMTRTPKEAAEGRLNLLVGGPRDLFDECKPLLDCFAENIVHAGPTGAGHQLKLLHNFVSLGFSAVLAEAAACAQRAGVAPDVFVDVLAKGGGSGAVLERLRPYIERGDVANFRFSIANAQKDIGYYRTMATELQAAHLTADAIGETYSRAVASGLGSGAVPELVGLLARGQ